MPDTGADSASMPGSWSAVAAGWRATCGLRLDGTAECWGNERYLGSKGPQGGPFEQVVLGTVFGCGLQTDGTLSCWGCQDSYMGHPSCEPPEGTFTEIEAGTYAACARHVDGEWICWGDNVIGLGAAPLPEFERLDVSDSLVCGLEFVGAQLECLGRPNYTEQAPPQDLSASQVAFGLTHGCALDLSGDALCWGLDITLGPIFEPPPGRFVDLQTRQELTCGLREDGTAECWGSQATRDAFDITPPEVPFVQLTVGNFHACGLTADGHILCWGDEYVGELTPPD